MNELKDDLETLAPPLIVALPIIAVACWFLYKSDPPPPTPEVLAPAPSTLVMGPELPTYVPNPEWTRAKERKNEMIIRCEKQGGTAAVGFGTTVICVKPMWVEDPKFPKDP